MDSQTTNAETQKIAELVARDYHLGLLAQVTEYQSRTRIAEGLLEAEMTRAYNAERELLEARRDLVTLGALRQQLVDIQNSTTWKLGRLLMLPIRLLRRVIGR